MHVIEGKRVIDWVGGIRGGQVSGGEKALQIEGKSFMINGFCNEL